MYTTINDTNIEVGNTPQTRAAETLAKALLEMATSARILANTIGEQNMCCGIRIDGDHVTYNTYGAAPGAVPTEVGGVKEDEAPVEAASAPTQEVDAL
jgi:hypothetical protein